MRIRTTYTVTPEDALADADQPIEVRVEDVTVSLHRIEDGLLLVVERPVDRSALEFGLFRRQTDGTELPIPTLKVPESELDTVAARDVLSALSFLSDTTLELSVRGRADDDVVPDDAEDEALLERSGRADGTARPARRSRHGRSSPRSTPRPLVLFSIAQAACRSTRWRLP
jgi:hypothetical protein